MKPQHKSKILTYSAVILGLTILIFLISLAFNPNAGFYIEAEQLSEQPSNFVDITPEQLENYPYIQKAISSPGEAIKVPYKDVEIRNNIDNFSEILQNNNTQYIKVNGKYYNIGLYWAD
ncbi:MAG: hypothetical protein PWQ44_2381 [Methanolobus sp.]|jgi:hypothetical protein|nr:hypothetical protein [Methanolobus sp.]